MTLLLLLWQQALLAKMVIMGPAELQKPGGYFSASFISATFITYIITQPPQHQKEKKKLEEDQWQWNQCTSFWPLLNTNLNTLPGMGAGSFMVQNLMWLSSPKGASQFQLPPAWGRYHSGHMMWIKNPGLGVFEAGVRAWPQCDVSCVTSSSYLSGSQLLL